MRAADYAFFDVPFAAFAHRGEQPMSPTVIAKTAFMPSRRRSPSATATWRPTYTPPATALLAFHDRVLDRVTDRTGAIAELTYAEIADARIHGLDPIPRLSELLAEFRRTVQRRCEVTSSGGAAGSHDR